MKNKVEGLTWADLAAVNKHMTVVLKMAINGIANSTMAVVTEPNRPWACTETVHSEFCTCTTMKASEVWRCAALAGANLMSLHFLQCARNLNATSGVLLFSKTRQLHGYMHL